MPPLLQLEHGVGVGDVAVGVAVRVDVAVNVAVAPPVVAVAVGVAVRVAVAPPVQAPSLRHQLSEDGLYGDAGGQSREVEIVPMVVYFVPLYETDTPRA